MANETTVYDPNNFNELEDFWIKTKKLTEENFVGAWWINFIPISVLSLESFTKSRSLVLELSSFSMTSIFIRISSD